MRSWGFDAMLSYARGPELRCYDETIYTAFAKTVTRPRIAAALIVPFQGVHLAFASCWLKWSGWPARVRARARAGGSRRRVGDELRQWIYLQSRPRAPDWRRSTSIPRIGASSRVTS